ncbi:hypothetical protein [Actinomadura sp. BRA 177]|uniref:hypothetical protein n=1 Tax=Actinomadura sp. BRA 177 TaxID=2745202 RepID=UPI0026E52E65|nr:hypothetical protein [Actinomadura sp. BRA 177]
MTQLPKLRPPRPHSSRLCMVSGRRHRAATKPIPLTSAKSSAKMTISVMWSLATAQLRFFVSW